MIKSKNNTNNQNSNLIQNPQIENNISSNLNNQPNPSFNDHEDNDINYASDISNIVKDSQT